MEPIIKEKETVYVDGYSGHYGNSGGGNIRGRANAGLTLGIIGTVLGGAALARQGGIGSILGANGAAGSSPAGAPSVNYTSINGGSGAVCCAPSVFSAYSKECEDILALTNTVWGLKVGTLQAAQAARDVDVAEKFSLWKSQIDADFGLYINNLDNIDRVNNRINNELFSLYKYTRDKDDETNARIAAVETSSAVNAAVRPYQDKLIQCEIEKSFAWLKNYIDRKTCRMIEGVNTLPLTPEVTGVLSQTCCNQQLLAALAGGGAAAAADVA
jgi:hypothetical protein